MSSADGALLALSTLFSRNIVPVISRGRQKETGGLALSRLVVVLFAVLTTLIGTRVPRAFLLMNFGFDCLLAGLFVPLTLGIYWKRAGTAGFFAGALSGIFVRIILSGLLEGWSFEAVMYPEKWYIYTMVAPVANLLAMVTVSLIQDAAGNEKKKIVSEN